MRTGKGPIGRYRCHGCGAIKTAASAQAGPYCGERCVELRAARVAEVTHALVAAGFARHPEVSNLMVRDGYAVSIEEAVAGGVDRLVRKHADWKTRIEAARG